MKYLELFKNGFDSTLEEKVKYENWPYVGYSPNEGLRFTIVPKDGMYEVTFLQRIITEDLRAIEYQEIDLGLPSGTKWLDRNIGSMEITDNGAYFQYGNIDGYSRQTVTLTKDEVVNLLLGNNYTDEDYITLMDDIDKGLLSSYRMSCLVDYNFGDDSVYADTFGGKFIVTNTDTGYSITNSNADTVLAENIDAVALKNFYSSDFDIVNQLTNGQYITPSYAHFQELLNNTVVTMKTKHATTGSQYDLTCTLNQETGVLALDVPEEIDWWDLNLLGLVCTSTNGNSIYFPCSGYCIGFSSTAYVSGEGTTKKYKPEGRSFLNYEEGQGSYMVSGFCADNARCPEFICSFNTKLTDTRRCIGVNIRGIKKS